MSDEMDDVLNEFIVESYESLDDLDRELVTLEQNANPDSLAGVFRAVHTIKGTSGFFGFNKLEAVTHVGENLLSKLRDGETEVDRPITSALLSMVDAVRDMIDSIQSDGVEGTGNYDALISELEQLESGEAPTADTDASSSVDIETVLDAAGDISDVVAEADIAESTETIDVEILDPESLAADTAETVDNAPTAAATGHVANESIRVDVGLLDDLMNLVGELVLARNQIIQYTGTNPDATFSATSQRLNLITTELQEGVMRTRMQPIENVWNKFPRIVRDLSIACGKQADLAMEGKHTELDKTLLEAIKDPLTHLVRNSVDHGLETPEARLAKGKPAGGTVALRAFHEGGQVIIEISDDGAGIDPAVIRRKAVEKGLLTKEEAAGRNDREIINVIFQPGFSTAAEVTNISGRGVGMDVVRTNIESIGGSVDIASTHGLGTTVRVKIPLTLAIIPALVVACDEERFAIPQVSLLELVRIDGHDPQSSIEYVHGAPVYRLRGRLLPVVYLHEVFGEAPPEHSDGINIVVLEADNREFGLVVDEISDTAEIVVKPLGRVLKQVSAFAGATIMGDGRVALILDVMGIAEHIGMTSTGAGKQHGDEDGEENTAGDLRRLLMFRLGDRRLALLLEMVARLEEFTTDQIEVTSTGRVVQYRDEILNLVFLSDELGIPSTRPEDAPVQVVVYTDGDRSVGVVVDDIFDIVEQRFDIQHGSAAAGMLGSAVIQDRVTDILDIEGLLRLALPALFAEEAA